MPSKQVETQPTSFSDPLVLIANMLWDSMDAEYPSQWNRAMGDSPLGSHKRISVKGRKWADIAMSALDGEGKLSKNAISNAIVGLRQRKNKTYLPTLGEFEDAINQAIADQMRIAKSEPKADHIRIDSTDEQKAADGLKYRQNQLMFGYMAIRSIGSKRDRRLALQNYLSADPGRSRWKNYVNHLGASHE